METQCPHCDTQFRITESQVNTAEGFVRCGVCKEVFNAFDVAKGNEQQPSLLDEDSKETTRDDKQAIFYQAETENSEFEQSEFAHSISASDNTSIEDTEDGDITSESHTDRDAGKDEFDFFDEDIIASQNSVVPDELRETTSAVNLSGLLWSAATLMLIASLFIEYTWFNRHQLSQVPELQVWFDKLCLQVDCSNISVRDPENIELITRNVFSHPSNKDALMIAVTIKNNAEFAQPYPVMQIGFSDIRGGTVVARRFLPSEYLQVAAEELGVIQSGSNVSFTMEILDPGNQAQTYQFDFL